MDFEHKESRFTCIGDSHESPEHQPRYLGGHSKIPELSYIKEIWRIFLIPEWSPDDYGRQE